MIEFLTGLLVLVTLIYVWLTHQILETNQKAVTAMKEQIKASVRPYVFYDLVPCGPLIEAHLKNGGITAAHNVRVSIQPELRIPTLGPVTPSALTGHPTSLLPPGRELVEFVGSWDELKQHTGGLAFTGVLTYNDSSGEQYKESFQIDLSARLGMAYIGRPETAAQLENIAKALSEIGRRLADIVALTRQNPH